MRNKIISINGESWCRKITGIERTAIEVTSCLDEMVKPGQMELVVPRNALNLPELRNIKVIVLPFDAGFMPKWTQVAFQKYVIMNNRMPLDFSNTCPFFRPGFDYIHDIYMELSDEPCKSKRDRLIKIYSSVMYKRIAKKSPVIFTVSEYSKKTIVEKYGINPDKVKVVYSGLSSLQDVEPDFSVLDRIEGIKAGEFYFSLGSLAHRKNLKWILEHAKLYPGEKFVVSGKNVMNDVPAELEDLKNQDNILMCGYLNDAEVKALEAKCKAFIMPSYFEGFGMPPLEALSAGAKVIVSKATCFPEIYGNSAYYIDPDEPDVKLDDLLAQKVDSPKDLLEKYTLKNTAKMIYNSLKDYLI